LTLGSVTRKMTRDMHWSPN